ncbi:anhydro-N-acetylmuramic acid kinase [Parenemella sanctibonifatiensis]|uniref:Anhydro-N-acetylmuramic acid kinase n=2 Tax=Parenemella sanctibonifatiensis TaxID=2016505 RepID=A0A255EBC5_9ACTN|nr:anhydro-N-acetylmuramic acid kinase [Parenemella sanctibonifatiensis]
MRGGAMRIAGILSGTSLDGIDVAVVHFGMVGTQLRGCIEVARTVPWPEQTRGRLVSLLTRPTAELAELARLHAAVGEAFGEAAAEAIAESHGPVDLICSHGQNIAHVTDGAVTEATWQLGDPARIHARTGVPVIADVRAADVASGGAGAPLAPILDTLLVGGEDAGFLNIGGIANVTRIRHGEVVCGDTGPGNCLLDDAVRALSDGQESFDRDGVRARAGQVDEELLTYLVADPYFGLPMPRSTGREHFSLGELGIHVDGQRARWSGGNLSGADLVRTLVELTARTVADAFGPGSSTPLHLSGGGADNPVLVERLADLLPGWQLRRTEELGVDSDHKEAVLFALIGWLGAYGLPGVVSAPTRSRGGAAITGAREPAVLGSLTPPDALSQLDTRGMTTPARLILRTHVEERDQ